MSKQKRPGLVWAWAVLLTAGANQLLWNLWHAFDLGMPGPLALALGAMPVLLAIGTSAIATRVRGGKVLRLLTYAVMLSAIGLSIWAQYELLMLWTTTLVVAVLFPAVGDLAVLIALHTLISDPRPYRSAAGQTGASEQTGTDEGGEQTGTRPRGWLVHQTVSSAEPLERSVPAAEVPAEPVQAGSVPAARTEPVPAVRTGSVPVPDRSVPAEQTGTVPAADRSAERGTDRTVPALTSTKAGDDAALEQLDRAFAGVDPAEVSIGMVRKALDGAGFARGKRLHGLWVARTGADRTADRPADRYVDRSEEASSTDRSGEQTGTGSDSTDHQDGTDRTDRAEEPDRTADRATVPA